MSELFGELGKKVKSNLESSNRNILPHHPMLALLPRWNSNIRPAFICTTCRYNLLGRTDPLSHHTTSVAFSTTRNYGHRRRRKVAESRSAISSSPDALERLRQSLIAEENVNEGKEVVKAEKKQKSKPPKVKVTEKATKKASPAKAKETAKAARKESIDKAKQAPKAAKEENPEKAEKIEGKILAKKKTKYTKTEKPADTKKPARGKTPGISKKPTVSGISSKINRISKLAIKAQVSSKDRGKGTTVLVDESNISEKESHGQDDKPKSVQRKRVSTNIPVIKYIATTQSSAINDESTTREVLVKCIESGSLSPADTVKAVRKLRADLIRPQLASKASLVRTHLSGKGYSKEQLLPVTKASSSSAIKMEKGSGFSSIKDAMKSPTPSVSQKVAPSAPKPPKNIKTGPIPKTKAQKKAGFEIETLSADGITMTPIERAQKPVPKLSYGLDRVLFNPGVYHLQDPRSRVFNFDPYLQKIMPVKDFDFNALKAYTTSSRDEVLIRMMKEQKKKYTGSTSSMSAALAHFHFLLSAWRPINTSMLSKGFPVQLHTFTQLQKGPSAVFLRYKDGAYAIDADKEYDTSNILAMLGKSMEKLLTLPKEEFEKYRRKPSGEFSEQIQEDETFHYTTLGDFLLRSQLDAYDPRIPGTGMFDLKTRAVVSIRMDVQQYETGMGYEIQGRHGEYQSFEREYYDMIRAAFLKYSLQVRMGRMDGIFVAFHNIERIFGFQYISLPELDLTIHGTEDTTIGDNEFKLSLDLLNKVLNRATEKYPEKSLRLHFESRGEANPFMYIFAEPLEEDEIDRIQTTNSAEIAAFEKRVLNLIDAAGDQQSLEERKSAEWEILRSKVESSIEEDEMDIQEMRDIAETLLAESEYWDDLSLEEKEKCIEALVKSSTFNEGPDEQNLNESHLVDSEDGTSKFGDEIPEDDTVVQEEYTDEQDDTKMAEEEEVSNKEEQLIDQDISPGNDSSFENGIAADKATTDEEMAEPNDSRADNKPQSNDKVSSSYVSLDHPVQATLEDKQSSTNESITPGDEPVKDSTKPPVKDVLAMTLVIRNLVDGEYVARPLDLKNGDKKWTVEYALADVEQQDRAQLLYTACKRRRYEVLATTKKDKDAWGMAYVDNLKKLSQVGRRWREKQDNMDSKRPTIVLGEEFEEKVV